LIDFCTYISDAKNCFDVIEIKENVDPSKASCIDINIKCQTSFSTSMSTMQSSFDVLKVFL